MEYLLKASGLATTLFLFYILFLKNETFFKSIRYYFLAGLILSVSIPLIEIPIYIEQTIQQFNNVAFSNSSETNVEQVSTADYITLLYIIYIAVALFFAGKFLIQLISLVKLIYHSKKTKQGNLYLIETTKDISPFSFFNLIVFNPTHFSLEELEHIINHEKAHVNQWHSLDTLFSHLLVIVLWFNPFVWFYKKSVLQNLEFLADKYAIDFSEDKKQYQLTLLKTGGINYCTSITNNFYNSLIKKRIIMLHKQPSNKNNQWKYALLLPIVAIFMFAFNTTTIAQQKESKWEFKTHIDQITITVDKNSTDTELKKDLKKFKKEFDITLDFKRIKRNSEGEITAIKITAKSKNSNTNYSVSGKRPIKPILISFTNNLNSVSIGSVDASNLIKKPGKGKETVVKINDIHFETNNLTEIKEGVNSFITKSDQIIYKIDTDKNKNKGEPLYIIDGKEHSKEKMDEIDPNNIEKIEVFKGDKAIEKYGDKGKNGVIEITTKN